MKYGKKFSLEDSPIVQTTDQILEQGRVEQPTPQPAPQPISQQQPAPTPQPQQPSPAPAPDASASGFKPLKTKKTENGIVINVPMQDYMQLTMMKMQTGRTLKDLALQAIHEFIENHQEELR